MAERGEPLRRVLIVEDDPVIAFGLEDLLVESGFEIAGVAPTLPKALALIELGACDAAIVDANLDGVSASPAGAAMTLRGLPYIVLSGYSAQQQGGAFAGAAAYMQKPCVPKELLNALEMAIQGRTRTIN
jgi:DNA-binding response OmpR family regulator